MPLQLSTTVRNARLDQIETTIGTSPYLDIRTGVAPANTTDADAGTELVHIALPSDWMAAATAGQKAKTGTWSATAAADGTANHFRVKDNGDATCHIQGSVSSTDGGGEIELDNTSISTGQTVTITTFTLTDGNA